MAKTIFDIIGFKRKRKSQIDEAVSPATLETGPAILPVLPATGQTDKKKAAALKKSQGLTKAQVKALEKQFAAGKKKATLP